MGSAAFSGLVSRHITLALLGSCRAGGHTGTEKKRETARGYRTECAELRSLVLPHNCRFTYSLRQARARILWSRFLVFSCGGQTRSCGRRGTQLPYVSLPPTLCAWQVVGLAPLTNERGRVCRLFLSATACVLVVSDITSA